MKYGMKSIRGALLTSAASGVLILLGPSALAQTAPTADETTQADAQAAAQDAEKSDEIVITGFRSSLANSVATKRNSNSIVEAVSAEEVGKLPDISIAEALGRLPGLATQRLNGRSNVLSIRGLGPDFSTALLNGREQVTTSDNRGVEFDQYPAELLSAAVVYKTPYAGLIGQGLAGTVDLRTVRPLDKSERVIAVSGRYEFNGQGSLNPDSPGGGYRATGTIIDQFANDTIGVAAGIAFQSSPTQQEQFNAWGYAGSGTAASPFVIGGQKPFAGSSDLDRIGGFVTLQWEPTKNLSSTLDIYYTDFAEDNVIRGIEFPLAFGVGPNSFNVTAPVITAQTGGFATNGVFGNVEGVVRNDLNIRRAELFSGGWNGKYESDSGWRAVLDISYSRATRRDELIESYAGTGYGVGGGAADTLTFSQAPGGVPQFTSRLDYSATTGPNRILLTDPLGWGAGAGFSQAGFINAPRTVDRLWHFKGVVDKDVEFGPLNNIELGLDGGLRQKSRDINQSFLTLPGTTTVTNIVNGVPVTRTLRGGPSLPIPQAAILNRPTAGLGFLGFGPQVTLDTRYLLANVYVPVATSLSSFATPQSWVVNENVITGWAKLGIDQKLGAVAVTGDLGLQVVYTDQSSDGLAVDATAPGVLSVLPVSSGLKYTDFLPTLNLIFDFSDTLKLRFGAARTAARARLDQLSASQNLSVDITRIRQTDPLGDPGTTFGRNRGNPELRPYISNQVDLSLEKYFAQTGYVSIAAFYKDLNRFVNTGDVFIEDFSDEASIFLSPSQRASLGSPLGLNRFPSNNGNGRIRGIEVSLSVPLEQIAKPLSGFGFLTSASFTDSRVTTFLTRNPSITATTTVPGLSKWVVNSTLYFEKAGFEARISHRFRTEFLGELAAISATRTFRTSRPESIIDAQAGYAFTGNFLDGWRVTVQGLNLTDEPFETFQNNDDRQLIDSQRFGRTFLVGASRSF